MLEDYPIMEKKPNGRSVPPGGADSSSSKPFGKFSRRREPANFSYPKNEQPRKPKNVKNYDKRPRNRGQYFVGGKADTKVAEKDDPEYGSLYVSGSKKQNLNHLLNFHYTPRGVPSVRDNVNWNHGHGHKWLATTKHKYNKEHFLQANCQFIVKDGEDYTAHFADPDLLVNWDVIEQIRLQSSDIVACPICLDTPVAAKMTRCGHVYCWPCILHYLALSDKTWRKCPICYEAIHKKDLKSVVISAHEQFNVGEELEFKLMTRERGSLQPISVEQSSLKQQGLLYVSEPSIDTTHSKLLLAKPDEVRTIINQEKDELRRQLAEDEGLPEICFIEQALEFVQMRDTKLNETTTQVSEDIIVASVKQKLRISESSEESTEVVQTEEQDSSEEDVSNISAVDLEINQSHSGNVKPYYFYQAADGQHIYLHALNIKMLELAYGSLEACPLRIKGRILEKDTGSMTEELRKRLRYLKHLPLTCQFEVAEIDLSEFVPDVVLHTFEDQLELRAKRRHKRERDERRRERKIINEENLKWGRHPTPKLQIESFRQFPSCGFAEEESLLLPSSPSGSNLVSRSHSLSSLCSINEIPPELLAREPLAASASLDYSGPSFAQMLRDPNPGKAWGSRNVGTSQASLAPVTTDSDVEPEGYVPAPQFRQSFSDAFAVALEKAEMAHDNLTSGSSKKKKKKQKVLFTTGMAYSGK